MFGIMVARRDSLHDTRWALVSLLLATASAVHAAASTRGELTKSLGPIVIIRRGGFFLPLQCPLSPSPVRHVGEVGMPARLDAACAYASRLPTKLSSWSLTCRFWDQKFVENDMKSYIKIISAGQFRTVPPALCCV